MCIIFVKGLSQTNRKFRNDRRFKVICCTIDNTWEVLDELDDFPAFSIIQAIVASCIWFEIGFAQDRLDTSVGVLNVRSSFSFKGYHSFKVEVISICTVGLKIIELDSPNSNSVGNLVFIF